MPIIINTEARLHTVAHHCNLKPGTNQVDASAWAEAKKIKVVRSLLASGVLVEKDVESLKDTLKDVRPDEAIKLVKTTLDLALLEKWYDAESRRHVKEAIEKQLNMLTNAAKQAAEEATKKS